MATARRSIRRVVAGFGFSAAGAAPESGRSSASSLEEEDEPLARPEAVESSTFSTADQLADWLAHFGVDVSNWGSGGVKSVESLLTELRALWGPDYGPGPDGRWAHGFARAARALAARLFSASG